MLVNLTKCMANLQTAHTNNRLNVSVPFSFVNHVALSLMLEQGYVGNLVAHSNLGHLDVQLKYQEPSVPFSRKFSMLSTPSRIVSMSFKEIFRRFKASDFVVLSTSASRPVAYLAPIAGGGFYPSVRVTGLLVVRDVLAAKIGGQLLFAVY